MNSPSWICASVPQTPQQLTEQGMPLETKWSNDEVETQTFQQNVVGPNFRDWDFFDCEISGLVELPVISIHRGVQRVAHTALYQSAFIVPLDMLLVWYIMMRISKRLMCPSGVCQCNVWRRGRRRGRCGGLREKRGKTGERARGSLHLGRAL